MKQQTSPNLSDRLKTVMSRLAESAVLLPLGLLNVLTSRRGYAVRRSVAYGGLRRQTLDLYVPDTAAPRAPVVVFFHGGSWDSGSKNLYTFVGQSLASAGLTVAIPNYRLYPEVVFPGFVEDAARAVAWIGSEVTKGDRPLFVLGHSAGAQIAILLALDGRYLSAAGSGLDSIAGAIGLSGPYDFLPLREQRYKDIFPEEVRADSQPIAFVDEGKPPMLLVHGGADTIVLPRNTRGLAAALRARGNRVEERIYPGVGHLGTVAALIRLLTVNKAPVRADIVAFIRDVTGAPQA